MYCSVCKEPLGQIEGKGTGILCYKCNGYEKLKYSKCLALCKKKLNEINEDFKKGVIEGHTGRYFFDYINFGEMLYSINDLEDLPKIPLPAVKPVALNFLHFVSSNLVINWILDFLNYKTKDNLDYSEEIVGLPALWLDFFKKRIYIKSGLGIYIKDKTNKIFFYKYLTLIKYEDSLKSFGLLNPKRINKIEFDQIMDNITKLESQPGYIDDFLNQYFPIYCLCMCYLQYPNTIDKIFSFPDIYIDNQLLKIIIRIIDFYDNKRALYPKEFSLKNPYIVIRTLEELKSDLKDLPWDYLVSEIISSQFNVLSFPILINFNNKIYISPTRLKIAFFLMYERLYHNEISAWLSHELGLKFQSKVEELLSKNGVKIEDPISGKKWTNIIDQKKNTFEIDIIGVYKGKIIVIECKSFHPTAFYFMRHERISRKKKIEKFKIKFTNKVIPWINANLKSKIKKDHIQIECRKFYSPNKGNSKKFVMNFPENLKNVNNKKIIGLYITELNESFNYNSTIIHINFVNLNHFLKNL